MNFTLSIFPRLGRVPFHFLLIALCSWALYMQTVYRIPGGFGILVLPLVSLAVGVLTTVILITYLMGRVPVEEPFQTIFHTLERWSRILIIGFCYYSLFLLANARWDPSMPADVSSEILDIRRTEIDLGYPIRYSYAKLRSWTDPKSSEWLLLHYREQSELWQNQRILVQVHGGYFKVPWVAVVEPDQESQLRSVLKLSPTASQAWRQLVSFYLAHHRWPEARKATAEYLDIYPNQIVFANYTAEVLVTAGRFDDVIALLEPVAAKRANYHTYGHLGFALVMKGRKADGVKLLQSAIAMEPKNYWAYYALGYSYILTGEPRSAVPYFERILELRPNYPEIEDLLQKIKSLKAERKT